MIIQKRKKNGVAEIVLVTHTVSEERFQRAMEKALRLPTIRPEAAVFRVLE